MDEINKGRSAGKIQAVFQLSQRLMKGSKGRLYFLLTVVTLFKIEVVLTMPVILKYGFQAIMENDIQILIKVAIGGASVFSFNFAIMYFINVYGDAWITKFAFHAAKNSFKNLSGQPVASIQAIHDEADLFNRIAAGTGNIMAFFFCLADLLGNGAAVIILMIMLLRLSYMIGIFVIILVVTELFFVQLQFRYNENYSRKLQMDKEESIRRVRSLLEQLSFQLHNQTWEWMNGLYEETRKQWLLTQEKKIFINICIDSCLSGIHGLFKTGLVYSFMIKQEVFSSYADDLVSSFSIFNNLVTKTKGFGGSISKLPDFLVPIGKLDDVLKGEALQIEETEEACLLFKHVSVAVGNKKIIKNADFCVPFGSKVAIIGENGSGKSTLLKTIAGLYWHQDQKVITLGRKLAYIPADDSLFQGHSVLENISYSRDVLTPEMIKKQLSELGIHDIEALCHKTAAQLSGGEAKRVNIARGLLSGAEVILADEPTSCLDEQTSERVMKKFLEMDGRTVIYITHEPEYAKMADNIIFMQDGEIKKIINGKECENIVRVYIL